MENTRNIFLKSNTTLSLIKVLFYSLDKRTCCHLMVYWSGELKWDTEISTGKQMKGM
jgi:hypothetical protein